MLGRELDPWWSEGVLQGDLKGKQQVQMQVRFTAMASKTKQEQSWDFLGEKGINEGRIRVVGGKLHQTRLGFAV